VALLLIIVTLITLYTGKIQSFEYQIIINTQNQKWAQASAKAGLNQGLAILNINKIWSGVKVSGSLDNNSAFIVFRQRGSKMLNKVSLSIFLLISSSANAITLSEFSSRLVASHPYFVQLSLSEKISLLDQKSSTTYSDWNINAGASETFTGGEDTSSRLYKKLYATKYEVSANRKVESSSASVNLKHSFTRNDKDSSAFHTNVLAIDYVRPMLQNKDGCWSNK
jgi:hypothetical protein